MKEWVENIEHDKLTDEGRLILDKFDSAEDAHVGYVELQKASGKPFKLPKSIDSIQDENVKNNFVSQVNKLMGAVESEEDLKDINFSEGLADARYLNEDLVTALKKFATDEKIPKSKVTAMVKFINNFNQNMINTNSQKELEKVQKVKETLSVLFGGDKAVDENYESVRRLFQNHMGLSADEYNEAGKAFVEEVLMKNAIMSKGHMNLARDIVKEGTTETNQQTTETEEKPSVVTRNPKTAKALGW